MLKTCYVSIFCTDFMHFCLQYLSCVWSVIVYDTDPINKGISLFRFVFPTISVYKSS